MKLGIAIRPAYRRFGAEKYRKMKEHGYGFVDYDMADTTALPYTLSWEDAEQFILQERHRIEKAGLKVHQVHGPWRYPWQDATEEDRRERMEKMKRSIRFAKLLGCDNWVIHPIMPCGVEEAGTPDEVITWELNLLFMRELLELAKGLGITICLENMPFPKFSLASPDAVLRFVREMNDEYFKICLDTGHAAVFLESNVGEAVRRLGAQIRVLHIHDTKCGLDLHLMPYMGVIDWKDFSKALRENDFDGVFSLETVPNPALEEALFDEVSRLQVKLVTGIFR